MWKRLQGHVRDKEKHGQIGNPVLLETTYDRDQLRRIPSINNAQLAHTRHNAPAPLKSYNLTPDVPPNYRASEVPTVSESSIYSRPSHDLSYYYGNHAAASPYDDISPPSSPEPERGLSSSIGQIRRFRSMRDVSPMDDNRNTLAAESRPISNIPVSRKVSPALQTGDALAAPKQKFWEGKLVPNSKVKWDDYSGEPNSAGKPASVSPASYAQATPFDHLPMGNSAQVSGPQKKNATLTERMSRFGSKPTSVEPWSRTTGRSEIAPVLKDDPTAKSLLVPRKAVSPAPRRTDPARSSALAPALNNGLKAPKTQSVTPETLALDTHDKPIKPVVPLKVGRKASPTPTKNQGLGINLFSRSRSVTPTSQRSGSPDTVVSAAVEAILHPTQRTATPPYTAAENKTQKSDMGKDVSASRFSWTTYNSATTYQHSPPPSPPPPHPSSTPLPKQRVVTEPVSAGQSILNRRRPVPQADNYFHQITPARNLTTAAAADDTPGTAKIRSPSALSPSSPSGASALLTPASTATKALPQPPTTLTASDHIGQLESQLEDLRIRRSNVYRLHSDLVNAAPANPLLTDFRRAREVEQRKRGFEDELSEIKREEHDVGLRLHRAWKRKEREEGGSGSALWVRRVTS